MNKIGDYEDPVLDEEIRRICKKFDNITHADLAIDAVEADNIKDGEVGTAELATDAVETAKIKDANVTFVKLAEAAIRQIMPVGSVIAWTNHLIETPALPDGWKLCDGTAISDADSPMNGEIVPDYNGDLAFLRGGATSSNTKQDDAMQGHWHEDLYVDSTKMGWEGVQIGSGESHVSTPASANVFSIHDPASDGVNGTPRTATETRPINMTVKWIMRIK